MKFFDVVKYTFFIRSWGFLKVPMIAWLRPVVAEFSEESVVIDIPLFRRSKNHLNSLYFGALCVGADIAGGLLAMHAIEKNKLPINLVFSDLSVKFLKRATSKTRFTCNDGQKIRELIQSAMAGNERVSSTVTIMATCPDVSINEAVAEFHLTISMKKRGDKKPPIS
jgi:hypothetical protein